MAGIFTDIEDKSKTILQYHTPGGTTPNRVTKIRVLDLKETTSYRSGRELSEDEEIRQNSSIYLPTRYLSSPEDTGHEFQSSHSELIRLSHPHFVVKNAYGKGLPVIGPLVITVKAHPLPIVPTMMSTNDLNVFGSRAIQATIPTSSDASTVNLLGELYRDGLPTIIGSLLTRTKNVRSVGAEYLNVEFGWKPLVSDLTKLMHSVKNSSRIIQQLKRDSGRTVRRRFSFPETVETSQKLVSYSSSESLLDGFSGGSGGTVSFRDSVSMQTRTITRVWFSGAYSYYLDPGDSILSKAIEYEALANKVLGTRLTPSALWELAPWSWLVDWFMNVGSCVSNASALGSDGLVIKYGYLMRHTVSTYDLSVLADLGSIYYPRQGPIPVVNSYRLSRKERWKASPYGFGLNLSSLSVRQWAILVALGLTNAPLPKG